MQCHVQTWRQGDILGNFVLEITYTFLVQEDQGPKGRSKRKVLQKVIVLSFLFV